VALPGVQVLFAFLLTVPFTQRFNQVTELQRDVYVATLLLTAAATVLLIAPAAFHRIQFRQHDKRALLRTSNAFALVGLALLALAMTGVILLIADLLFGTAVAAVLAAVTAVAFACAWYGLPTSRRLRGEPEEA
jgi:hypothetical protein